MINVIFISPGELPIPSEKGAIEEIIWKVSLELWKLGFNVYICNPPSKTILSKLVKGLLLSKEFINSREGLILHFHDVFACLSYLSKSPHIENVVLTLHYPPWRSKDKKHFVLLFSILKCLANRNVVIAAPSKVTIYWLRKYLNANTFFLPNGVDTMFFHPSNRSQEMREKLLGNKDVLISYVARIHPDKNQLDLLKTIDVLVNNYKVRNIRVAFVGPIQGSFVAKKYSSYVVNPYFTLLKRFVEKKGLKDYVIFLGELPKKEDVARVLASSDIYVHTAIVEAGVPLAIMEAMASGLPIVAYDLVYYRGYLRNNENSILVKRRDMISLANVLEILVTQKETRRVLSIRARIFAEENLSWEKVTKNYYVVLYERLQ